MKTKREITEIWKHPELEDIHIVLADERDHAIPDGYRLAEYVVKEQSGYDSAFADIESALDYASLPLQQWLFKKAMEYCEMRSIDIDHFYSIGLSRICKEVDLQGEFNSDIVKCLADQNIVVNANGYITIRDHNGAEINITLT